MSRRTLFIGCLVFELLAVFGLFLPYAWLKSEGTVVTLRTVPVDPRSLFRGDYVVLDYEVGHGLPNGWAGEVLDSALVYVHLGPTGEVFERTGVSTEYPPILEEGQACLRGLTNSWDTTIRFPDIAQYFVPEGMGKELEQLQTVHRLLVDVVVDDECHAMIDAVKLGPEVPEEELPDWMRPPRPEDIPPRAMPVEMEPVR